MQILGMILGANIIGGKESVARVNRAGGYGGVLRIWQEF